MGSKQTWRNQLFYHLRAQWAWMLWGVPEAHRETRQRKLLVLPREGYTGTYAVHMRQMGSKPQQSGNYHWR